MTKILRILIADDSSTTRLMLSQILMQQSDMNVVGTAVDGVQAVEMAEQLRPDLILMDMTMPRMDGLTATREIMHYTPTPIVVISASIEGKETDFAFEAMNAGALSVLKKPVGYQDPDHGRQVTNLLQTIRMMAAVQVIHHWRKPPKKQALPILTDRLQAAPVPQIVGIVASTGGPASLKEILHALPADFRQPIVIVQHIAPDFVASLCGWLKMNTVLPVEIARHGDMPRGGTIYLAPGDVHLSLGRNLRFVLDRTQRATQHMPSGDILLESIANSYGPAAVGVVLTGMGTDGAYGLKAMYDAGAVTIAQDEATAVVYGMPRAAAEMGAAKAVLPLQEIAPSLIRFSTIEELS